MRRVDLALGAAQVDQLEHRLERDAESLLDRPILVVVVVLLVVVDIAAIAFLPTTRL